MKKPLSMMIIALMLLLGFGSAFATGPTGLIGTDDLGNPNDPNKNERANACFEGGTMAGKCDSEWAWTCGWYLIRYEAGIFSRAVFPDTCAILLPSLIESAPTSVPPLPPTWPPAGCYYSPAYDLYLFWDGNQTQPPPLDLTWDGTCATPPHTGVGGFFLVSTANATDAAALCATYGYPFIDEISSAIDTGAWPIYRCQIP